MAIKEDSRQIIRTFLTSFGSSKSITSWKGATVSDSARKVKR
jgi:hypothetical protein